MEGLSVCLSPHLCLWKVSPPLSVRQIAFYLPDPAEPQELLTLSEEGRKSEKLGSVSIRFICFAALIWTTPILSGAGGKEGRGLTGGWGRQQRRDKPWSEEMASQTEEWQFLGSQMIIPMHYSELWWIMDLQEETRTGGRGFKWVGGITQQEGVVSLCFSSLMAEVLPVYWRFLFFFHLLTPKATHTLCFLTFSLFNQKQISSDNDWYL